MTIYTGTWERSEEPIIIDQPEGCDIRWRFRQFDYARVYLRFADRTEAWVPAVVSGNEFSLSGGFMLASNHRGPRK